MKYRLNRIALLTRMGEYGQNIEQRLNYLKHCLSCLMSEKHWYFFNKIAIEYNIYYMLLQDSCIELKIKYRGICVVVKKKTDEYIIEIHKV